SVDEFLAWSAKVDKWYEETSRAVDEAGLRSLVLRYDEHLRAEKERVVPFLRRALRELDIDVWARPQVPPGAYFMQDKLPTPFKKIGNGDAVEAQLRALGRLDYALD